MPGILPTDQVIMRTGDFAEEIIKFRRGRGMPISTTTPAGIKLLTAQMMRLLSDEEAQAKSLVTPAPDGSLEVDTILCCVRDPLDRMKVGLPNYRPVCYNPATEMYFTLLDMLEVLDQNPDMFMTMYLESDNQWLGFEGPRPIRVRLNHDWLYLRSIRNHETINLGLRPLLTDRWRQRPCERIPLTRDTFVGSRKRSVSYTHLTLPTSDLV